MKAQQRTDELHTAAYNLAGKVGVHALTHAAIARAADVSESLVKVRLGKIEAVRRRVMRVALKQRDPVIVSQGLVLRDRIASKADAALRQECAALVLSA